MDNETNDVPATNGAEPKPEQSATTTEFDQPETVVTGTAAEPAEQAQEAAPVTSQSESVYAPQPLSGGAVVPTAKKRSKALLPIVFAAFLVLGGSAAAYVTVYQRSPEKIWSRALSNTASGLETILESGTTQQQKGVKMVGTLDVKSPVVIDGEMKGAWLDNNGSFVADVNTSGVRMNVELRTIAVEGAQSPDIYMKVDGLTQVSSLLEGALGPEADSLIGSINEQWFYVDHTLLDQYLQSADEEAAITLSEEDLRQLSDKLMVVMRDRMFASDEKAVFTLSEKIGKETFEGADTYKVKVAVNKENFKALVIELKDAIKGTKLEELLKASDPEKSLEELLDFDQLLEQLDKADFSKATAEAWIEANGGYIRNVRVYPEQDNATNYIDFGLNYTGGDSFPLSIKLTMDDESTKGTFSLGMNVNPKTQGLTMTLDADMKLDGEPFKMGAQMSLSGSDEAVAVEEPVDAINILELMGELQGSSLDTYESFGEDMLLETDSLLYDDTELTQ